MGLQSKTVLIEEESASKHSIRKTLPMSVCFLVSRAEHARMWRRISHLAPYFQSSFVAAFERTGLPVGHSHNYLCIGRLTHRKFLERIPIFLVAVRKCFRPVKTSEICYAFSLDLLLLLFFLKFVTRSRTKLVYEVADIHPILSAQNIRGRAMRLLERSLIRRCCAVVLTSPAFRSGYFAEVQGFVDFPSVVIEHKVALPEVVRNGISFRPPRDSKLVIGYIGLMKSRASFALLTRLAEAGCGRIVINFHGRFVFPNDPEECLRIIDASPYLNYDGPYQSPEDLERIYTNMDMVWDAYKEGQNAQWQRTTRFSEACFFKRPIIHNPDTQDGRLAEYHGLGLAMSFDDPNSWIQKVLSIDEVQLRDWFENFNALPRDLVFYEREYDDLVNVITGVQM